MSGVEDIAGADAIAKAPRNGQAATATDTIAAATDTAVAATVCDVATTAAGGLALEHNGFRIDSIEDFDAAVAACADGHERFEVMQSVYTSINEAYVSLEDLSDPFLLRINDYWCHFDDAQKAAFQNFEARHTAASARQVRYRRLTAAISREDGWGPSYLNHPYVFCAEESDGLAKQFRVLVGLTDGSSAVNAISHCILQRFAASPKYSSSSARMQPADLGHLIAHYEGKPSGYFTMPTPLLPVTRSQLLAAERGIKSRPDYQKSVYHNQFRRGERYEVVSFNRRANVTFPYPPDTAGRVTATELREGDEDEEESTARSHLDPAERQLQLDLIRRGMIPTAEQAQALRNKVLANAAGRVFTPLDALDDARDPEEMDDSDADGNYVNPDGSNKRARHSGDADVSSGKAANKEAHIAGAGRACRCDDHKDKIGISTSLRRRIERLNPVTKDANVQSQCMAMFAKLVVAFDRGRHCCYSHLYLAVDKVGFYKNGKTAKDMVSLIRVYASHGHAIGDWLATDEAYSLIKRPARSENRFDTMKLANFMPDEDQLKRVGITGARAEAILNEINPRLQETWNRDGTIVTGIFRFIEDAGLADIFREEFRMYRYHLRLPSGQKDLGWLRNAHHTLFQQFIRMDPLYYLLYVCLRPDHATALLSYVYYAKLASIERRDVEGKVLAPASQTFFRHIDLNMENVLQDDATGLIIQGSVSLTDEDQDNCTEIIPKLHARFAEYWADLQERGVPQSGGLVNAITDRHFTETDKLKFQTTWRKEVCKTGDARISSPLLPHGSTGPVCTLERMTALPWFVKIRDNGVNLDHLSSGTANEVAAAHRNLTHCVRSPSGKPNIYGNPSRPFPAAVQLKTDYHIAGATVGRYSYDDYTVKKEQKVLFGDDARARAKLIRDIRSNHVAGVKKAWELVKEAEQAYFGDRSYFKRGSEPVVADALPAQYEDLLEAHAEEIEHDAAAMGDVESEANDEDMDAGVLGIDVTGSQVLKEEDKVHPTAGTFDPQAE
jgi:hypothetical protein